ncbi:hypothetical protein CAOG_00536 [Capsaspora owczarzaki ATCC 30864]|uniref:Transmembrane protein n=1 Tax=Capsaspora owczarzaki (strain ATCC 30864) TaxID=595528 RepID=A0A0D2U178_CAPO3|nr:hypothetical protein CAOG_00536 [Capsaspora owczarzaki ATCC 30864]KJE88971.1 hypothetical protein CAOG_000536 [Capsaspora owczarzaki ATCC 30864]|eukprot:XP_004365407.1 hypothetical protein CAOG_00536 [Capsaspora owczarzaki ATCC 30864]
MHASYRPSAASASAVSNQEGDALLAKFDPLQSIALARLKQASNTSALLAGFTMTSLAQIAISDDIPDYLVTCFGISMVLLIVVHLFALMISTFVLPEISAFIGQSGSRSDTDILKRFHRHITVAWLLSTALGIFLFLTSLITIVWIQFWNVPQAAIASTAVVLPALAMFLVLACKLYRDITSIQLAHHRQTLRDATETVFGV